MRFRIHIPPNLIPAAAGTQVYVYLEGTSVPVPFPIYADGSSSSTLANPYSHPGGPVVFHLPVQARVSIGLKPAGAASPVIAPVVAASDKVFAYSTMKAGGRPVEWVMT